MIDWNLIFDEVKLSKGASEPEIADFVKEFPMPLSEREIEKIRNDLRKINLDAEVYDPAKWSLPNKPFPLSFLDFLTWNNGGWCRTGEREFGFFSTADLREYTLAYMFPEWMKDAVPFALDGGGVFYVFDMRREAKNGEYPILTTAAGNQGYDDAVLIADSFIEACSGNINIEELL